MAGNSSWQFSMRRLMSKALANIVRRVGKYMLETSSSALLMGGGNLIYGHYFTCFFHLWEVLCLYEPEDRDSYASASYAHSVALHHAIIYQT